MAFFRNLTSIPARAWAFAGAGVWREYECAPGATLEVQDSDAPVFRGQPHVFAEVDGMPEPEPAEQPEPAPEAAMSEPRAGFVRRRQKS